MKLFFKRLKLIFSSDFAMRYRKVLEETDKQRKLLDDKLSHLTRATLNGEDEWFLELVKKDPECALNVIKECGENGE